MTLRERYPLLGMSKAFAIALCLCGPAAAQEQLPTLPDPTKPFSQIPQALSRIPRLAATLKRKNWPHCDNIFVTCYFDPYFEPRKLDPNSLVATASSFANQVAPQVRSYLTSLLALDRDVRASLARAHDRSDRARAAPENAELRAALAVQLKALAELLDAPGKSSDLLQAAKDFEQRIGNDDGVELAYLKHRQDLLGQRQSFEQTIKQPAYQQMCSQQPSSDFCKPPLVNDAPATAVIELETSSLLQLRSGNDAIKAVLPSLIGCVSATTSAETTLRDNLAQAISGGSFDQTNRQLDSMLNNWQKLTGYAKTCSDPRLWD